MSAIEKVTTGFVSQRFDQLFDPGLFETSVGRANVVIGIKMIGFCIHLKITEVAKRHHKTGIGAVLTFASVHVLHALDREDTIQFFRRNEGSLYSRKVDFSQAAKVFPGQGNDLLF